MIKEKLYNLLNRLKSTESKLSNLENNVYNKSNSYNRTEVDNKINNLNYSKGSYDYSYTGCPLMSSGCITSSRTDMQISFPCLKNFNSSSTITLNSLKLNIRTIHGDYLDSSGFVDGGKEFITSPYKVTACGSIGNNIRTIINKSSNYCHGGTSTAVTNNSPISVSIYYVKFTIS